MKLLYFIAGIWLSICISDAQAKDNKNSTVQTPNTVTKNIKNNKNKKNVQSTKMPKNAKMIKNVKANQKPKTKSTAILSKTTIKTVIQNKKKKTIKTVVSARTTSESAAFSLAGSNNGKSQLNNEITRIINNNHDNADVAVFVKSMKHGDTLYSRNIYRALTPASTMKVLTAEAALLYLGPEYRFATQLLTDAKSIKNGVLQGNLFIILTGDPTLAYYDLVELLMTLKNQGIAAITGNVYIDNTAYDQEFYGPGWINKDKGFCFAAPISASIINRNCLALRVTPSNVNGAPAQIYTSPRYFYPNIRNGVVTKAVRSHACGLHVTTMNPGNTISIDGCMPKGPYVWGVSYVVTNIPEYTRSLFKNLLVRLSIKVKGKVTYAATPDNLSLIGQHASKPLRVMINDMLKKSDNIIAGALFKKMGQLYTRKQGTWQNGSIAVSQILAKRANVDINGMKALDGSGLSADNLITPAQMMQVLDFAYHNYSTSYEFISSLPIAGVDGTLKHRMTHITRKVRAKTGTISGVVSLAGYVVTDQKEPLAFVIMINGNKQMGWRYKELEDLIVTALTRYKR